MEVIDVLEQIVDRERVQAAIVLRADRDISQLGRLAEFTRQDRRNTVVAAGLVNSDPPSILDDELGSWRPFDPLTLPLVRFRSDRLTIGGVAEWAELRGNRHWRVAVVWLRVGFCSLAIVVLGLILLAMNSTPWVLAIGVIAWLVSAITTAVQFMTARSELSGARPGFWSARSLLLHDTFHANT
jgi:hypothetical protein